MSMKIKRECVISDGNEALGTVWISTEEEFKQICLTADVSTGGNVYAYMSDTGSGEWEEIS